MMGDMEAAGDLATGALIARAVDGPGPGHGGGHLCLNCGTALIDAHCHRCGQSGHVHRSLGAIGHEILHGVAHFEGKMWRTLPMLAWRPGELTRRYIEGERTRFVSPMALFLFSIFSMFAAFSMFGLSPPSDLHSGGFNGRLGEFREQLNEQRADAVSTRDKRPAGDARRVQAEKRIADIDTALAALPAKSADGEGFRATTRLSGWPLLDHGIEKWNKNPSLMLYKLQSSSYKFSWLLIPLSLPFVWLLFFWRRQYKLYDHTVFITYSIAFMSLLLIAITIAGAIGVSEGVIIFMALVLPFVHLARQLKQAYALGWVSAILRAFVLSFFILIVVTLFVLILLVLGMS